MSASAPASPYVAVIRHVDKAAAQQQQQPSDPMALLKSRLTPFGQESLYGPGDILLIQQHDAAYRCVGAPLFYWADKEAPPMTSAANDASPFCRRLVLNRLAVRTTTVHCLSSAWCGSYTSKTEYRLDQPLVKHVPKETIHAVFAPGQSFWTIEEHAQWMIVRRIAPMDVVVCDTPL